MKIIMRRDFVIFQNHEIGYAKGETFLIKEFNQKTVLNGSTFLRVRRRYGSMIFVGRVFNLPRKE